MLLLNSSTPHRRLLRWPLAISLGAALSSGCQSPGDDVSAAPGDYETLSAAQGASPIVADRSDTYLATTMPKIEIEFEAPPSGEAPILKFDNESLDYNHRTAIVLVDHNDEVEVSVKETTTKSIELTLDAVLLDGVHLKTVENKNCTPGSPCTARLDFAKTKNSTSATVKVTCADRLVPVAFHVRTKHAGEANKHPKVFIRDPLVIIVPKTCPPPSK